MNKFESVITNWKEYILSDRRKPDIRESTSSSITQEDISNLPMIRAMIQKDIDYSQALFEYAQKYYDEECRRYADKCPDNTDLPDELYYKQVYLWFITEMILPSKGRTVLEEFAEKYVSPKDPEAAKRLLLSKKMIRGSFRTLDATFYPYVLIDHLESGTRYLAVSKIPPSPGAKKMFLTGGVIKGKIHPWWGKYFIFDGILTREPTSEEIAKQLGFIFDPGVIMERYENDQIRKFESISLNFKTTLSSALNKYPSQWVDGMCSASGISIKQVRNKRDKIRTLVSKLENGYADTLLREKFTREQIAILEMLYRSGWILKYGQLTKQFSSEISLWWNEDPPESDIGVLRLHGFLVVGKLPERGRQYKVSLVPLELRAPVEDFLRVQFQGSKS